MKSTVKLLVLLTSLDKSSHNEVFSLSIDFTFFRYTEKQNSDKRKMKVSRTVEFSEFRRPFIP